ncbi:hypothetical protein IQ07DRAFT_599117 [Pyrenochaeta sp. DS3sAY3a]|nr:hypothetical protein IQ07DRAFT_599117 [Pyrenochaeta sp. DS3sAY3a]
MSGKIRQRLWHLVWPDVSTPSEYGAKSIFRYGRTRQIGAPDSRGFEGDIETHTRCKAMEESDEHPRQALTRMQIARGMWKSPYRGRRQTYKDTKTTGKTNRKVPNLGHRPRTVGSSLLVTCGFCTENYLQRRAMSIVTFERFSPRPCTYNTGGLLRGTEWIGLAGFLRFSPRVFQHPSCWAPVNVASAERRPPAKVPGFLVMRCSVYPGEGDYERHEKRLSSAISQRYLRSVQLFK